MVYRKYLPLLLGFALLATGVSLGARSYLKASASDRIDSVVTDTETTGMASHGRNVTRPTFEYLDASCNEKIMWEPSHSATWYDYSVGQSVPLLVERNGSWRSVDDFRSLYLLPICLTVFGILGCLFGWVILRIISIQ